MCGEKGQRPLHGRYPLGSPPHMRGKVVRFGVRAGALGITPAYAGKSCSYNSRTTASGDHPRMCGEKVRNRRRESKRLGSSPRMRGKVFPPVSSSVYTRITPAYAGKRRQCSPQSGGSWDHPRVCGEKNIERGNVPCFGGSPPRMRGKALCSPFSVLLKGITPAYAGKRPQFF